MSIKRNRRTLLADSSAAESAQFQTHGRHTQVVTAYIYGTFVSATGKVQVSDGTTNWMNVAALTASTAGVGTFEGNVGAVRGKVTGGTTDTEVTIVCYANFTT